VLLKGLQGSFRGEGEGVVRWRAVQLDRRVAQQGVVVVDVGAMMVGVGVGVEVEEEEGEAVGYGTQVVGVVGVGAG
jgi:hypothetical protein